MPDLPQVLLGSLILLMFAASVGMWVRIVARLRAGQAVLPAEPRDSAGVLDLYIAFVLYLVVLFTYARVTADPAAVPKSDTFDAQALATNSVLTLSAMGLGVVYLGLRPGLRFVLGIFALR